MELEIKFAETSEMSLFLESSIIEIGMVLGVMTLQQLYSTLSAKLVARKTGVSRRGEKAIYLLTLKILLFNYVL